MRTSLYKSRPYAPFSGKELIKAEVTAIRDAILYVHDETVKCMNEGKDCTR